MRTSSAMRWQLPPLAEVHGDDGSNSRYRHVASMDSNDR